MGITEGECGLRFRVRVASVALVVRMVFFSPSAPAPVSRFEV